MQILQQRGHPCPLDTFLILQDFHFIELLGPIWYFSNLPVILASISSSKSSLASAESLLKLNNV